VVYEFFLPKKNLSVDLPSKPFFSEVSIIGATDHCFKPDMDKIIYKFNCTTTTPYLMRQYQRSSEKFSAI